MMAFKNKDWVQGVLQQRVGDKAVDFTEQLHRRDPSGKFTSGGGGGMPRRPGGGGPPEVYNKPIDWEGDGDESHSGVLTTPDGKKLVVRARRIDRPGYEKTPYESSYDLDGKRQGRQFHPNMEEAKARLLKVRDKLMKKGGIGHTHQGE